MNCYVCDEARGSRTAVAVCTDCGVALCREHLDVELTRPGPGGTRLRCAHEPAARARAARAVTGAAREETQAVSAGP